MVAQQRKQERKKTKIQQNEEKTYLKCNNIKYKVTASTSTRWHFAFRICCHSNETRAPTANPPNTQLGGTPLTFPKVTSGLIWNRYSGLDGWAGCIFTNDNEGTTHPGPSPLYLTPTHQGQYHHIILLYVSFGSTSLHRRWNYFPAFDEQELIRRWDSERELLRSAPGSYPNSLKQRKITVITPFKVIQGHRFWYQSKAHIRFPISD